jgi:hypothetical protein
MQAQTTAPPDAVVESRTMEERRTQEDRRRIEGVFERMSATPAEIERVGLAERRRWDRRAEG